MSKIDANPQAEIMEIVNPKEFFEEALPMKFKPEKAAGIDVVAQLDVVGPEGGNWIVIIKDQKLQVTEGIHLNPNLTLKMNESDFMDMVNRKISAEKAFLTGKVQFKGNISLALKLRETGFL